LFPRYARHMFLVGMKTIRQRLKIAVWVTGLLGLLLLVFLFVVCPVFNLFHAHEHCIKGTYLTLMGYAEDHHGQFPSHTNGFGDAVVMLLKEEPESARNFTAPGDDGHLLAECARTGAHMPEDRCTRTYVQGLSANNDPQIALVFDRYPTRGGDHFRRPWGPPQREVCFIGDSMRIIDEKNWPAFRARQIELLVAAHFPRADAEKLYAPISVRQR